MIARLYYVKTLSLVLIFHIVFYTSVYADLKVTKISRNNKSFDIVLNEDIKILNILFENNDIAFPVYIGKGKVYKQFSILKRDFKQYLVNSLAQNQILPKTKNTSFKVNKFSILKTHKKIKAFASVIFDDDIEVECRIMQINDRLWVAWPSNKNNNNWVKDFRFINRDLKEQVEKKLITGYTSNDQLK
jgi:DNA-binding cell septation regulator SpoVG